MAAKQGLGSNVTALFRAELAPLRVFTSNKRVPQLLGVDSCSGDRQVSMGVHTHGYVE